MQDIYINDFVRHTQYADNDLMLSQLVINMSEGCYGNEHIWTLNMKKKRLEFNTIWI